MAALARSVLVSERFEVAMERVWPDKGVRLFDVWHGGGGSQTLKAVESQRKYLFSAPTRDVKFTTKALTDLIEQVLLVLILLRNCQSLKQDRSPREFGPARCEFAFGPDMRLRTHSTRSAPSVTDIQSRVACC